MQRTTRQEHVRDDRGALPSRRRAQPNLCIPRNSREGRPERREDSGSLNRGGPDSRGQATLLSLFSYEKVYHPISILGVVIRSRVLLLEGKTSSRRLSCDELAEKALHHPFPPFPTRSPTRCHSLPRPYLRSPIFDTKAYTDCITISQNLPECSEFKSIARNSIRT